MVKSKVSKSKYGKRCPKEFRHQMVELHRAGNSVAELSKRFGPHFISPALDPAPSQLCLSGRRA